MTNNKGNIIKILGIESLPDEQKARILDQAAQVVEQRLLLRLMNSLTDDKRGQLNSILTSENSAGLDEFIAQEAPNYSDWVIEESGRLKTELESLGQLED